MKDVCKGLPAEESTAENGVYHDIKRNPGGVRHYCSQHERFFSMRCDSTMKRNVVC